AVSHNILDFSARVLACVHEQVPGADMKTGRTLWLRRIPWSNWWFGHSSRSRERDLVNDYVSNQFTLR
ncbi:MAG TPA: hypothetical protein QF564_02605, partial [Pirellulaceae bacterium]|nr:hypothetical protein [Pirellulaceae bacterium]